MKWLHRYNLSLTIFYRIVVISLRLRFLSIFSGSSFNSDVAKRKLRNCDIIRLVLVLCMCAEIDVICIKNILIEIKWLCEQLSWQALYKSTTKQFMIK